MNDRIKTVMSQVFDIDAATIDSTTTAKTVRRWDSLGHLNLCVALEEEFGVALTTEQVVGMTSYDAVVDALRLTSSR